MIRFTLAFVAGVVLFQYQPRLPHPALFAGYLALLACAVPLRWCRIPAWLVLGFGWAHGHAWLTRPAALPVDPGRAPVVVQGQITSMIDSNTQRTRFAFDAVELRYADTTYRGHWRLRLSWYRNAPELVPGDVWRLTARLRPVHGYANPGGFDFARALYRQGIRYQGSVLGRAEVHRLGVSSDGKITRLRQRIGRAMADTAGDAGMAGQALLRALVIGDRSGFSQADWRVFRATGTNHLVAISGLHVGLLAALVMAVVSWGWRRSPRLCARWPARWAGALGGWLTALGYAALAGFAIPTQRALLMLGVGLLMLLLGRHARFIDVLSMALLAVVCWSPMAVSSAGLWLSFAAVAVIFWAVADDRQRGRFSISDWGRTQLAVSIGLLPLLLAWFQQASMVAPLVNLLAIPVFSLLLVPLALLSTAVWIVWPAVGAAAWQALGMCSDYILSGMAVVAGWPWASRSFAAPSVITLVLALAGALLLFSPRAIPARWLAALLFIPALVNRPVAPDRAAFSLVLLDVGQGLAAVVRTRTHVLVYDAGPRYRSGFNTGDAVVSPYLRQLGVERVDRLIVSHSDTDHAGGVPALHRDFKITEVLEGEPDRGTPCRAGRHWEWDGVRFRILHPLAVGATGNNASCVLRVENASGSLLLTGDIEALSERQLLERGALQAVSVMVVPHHGSRTSSSLPFAAATHPQYALYAVDRDNRWGFPKSDIQARWQAVGASRWDTGVDGAVAVHFPAGGGAPRVRGYRRQRYWNP